MRAKWKDSERGYDRGTGILPRHGTGSLAAGETADKIASGYPDGLVVVPALMHDTCTLPQRHLRLRPPSAGCPIGRDCCLEVVHTGDVALDAVALSVPDVDPEREVRFRCHGRRPPLRGHRDRWDAGYRHPPVMGADQERSYSTRQCLVSGIVLPGSAQDRNIGGRF